MKETFRKKYLVKNEKFSARRQRSFRGPVDGWQRCGVGMCRSVVCTGVSDLQHYIVTVLTCFIPVCGDAAGSVMSMSAYGTL